MAWNPEVNEIFLQALEAPSREDRGAYLDRRCGNNTELRAQVQSLLDASDRAGSFLESPGSRMAATIDEPIRERPGTLIGPYKLLQQIGEGGMGVVWMAEQNQPVQRKVALKVIKPGMDSGQVIARFEAERQALAMMDHVNIARVLDAGATEAGRPYFVMELVHGVPITKYCDDNHLTPRERLELFVPVCQAIQHAHQKGIIHRDIKPSNVMITLYDGKPVPKVIDFGVAKATEQKLTERTLFTQYGTMVGTLEYMSPEQAEMSAMGVDTRSDIYSLGVLLYELLTGSTPLSHKRMKEAAYAEILRMIKEEDPPRPSTRLSDSGAALASISAQRHMEPAKLTKLVRGELDWIVMKTLEKDRNRRYETANGLAMDLQRYLLDEAVQACPPGTTYRLKKIIRRHKRPLLAVALVLIALVGGIIGTTLGLLRAQASEEEAQNEAWKAGQERDRAQEARDAEWKAKQAESQQRALAEERGTEMRRNLYFAEMNLAGLAAESYLGLARVAELLSHWQSGEPDLRAWEWYYLLAVCRQDLLTISESSDPIQSVAWSPDGTRLATNSLVRGPRVWNAVTGKEAVILAGRTGASGFSVVWSPDGTLLASGTGAPNGAEGTITIWDAVTGKDRLVFQGHLASAIFSLAWAPDGKRLASLSRPRTITISDASTGKAIQILTGHTATMSARLAWSRDGRRLASADESGTIKLWDGATGKESLQLRASGPLRAVSWSPDSSRLASATDNGTIEIWETSTAKRQGVFVCPGGGVLANPWSPDGKRLASGSDDGKVRIWDVAMQNPIITRRGHSSGVTSVAWSPDGMRLGSASLDGTVKVWDADQQDQPLRLQGHKGAVGSVSWGPDSKRLATASLDGMVKIWDAATGKEFLTLQGHTDGVSSVSWSSDSMRLASSGYDKSVKIWDPATGRKLVTLRGHTEAVASISWTSDGQRLASAGRDDTVRIWDAVRMKEIGAFKTSSVWDSDPVNAVSWSPDGTRLALTGNTGRIRIWDPITGESTCILKGHTDVANSVAWCPNGTRLASGGRDRTIKIWDATTGKEVLTLRGHTSTVLSVAWSPDGARLASAGGDSTVKIWDPVIGKETLTFRETGIVSIAWSPDGLRLAGSNLSAIPVIFDAAKGYRLAGRSRPGHKSNPFKDTGF